jgi:hypothetical protein
VKFGWTNSPVYGPFYLVFAVLMLVWCVAYGVADHRQDQCLRAFNDLSADTQAQLTATRARLEKNRARGAALNGQITVE